MANIRIKLKVTSVSITESRENATLKINVDSSFGNEVMAYKETDNTQVLDIVTGDARKTKEIKNICITCSKNEAKNIYELIFLKNILKDKVTFQKGGWWILLRNINNDSLKWSGWDYRVNVLNRYTINLKDSNLTTDNIDISSINIVDGTIYPNNNLNQQKTAFLNQLGSLNALLTKLDNYSDLLSSINDTDIDELRSYVNDAGIDKEGTDIKKTIYNIGHDTTKLGIFGSKQQTYKIKIDNLIKTFEGYRVWNKVIGLETVEEVKKANNNGFRIIQEGSYDATIGDATDENTLKSADNIAKIKINFPNNNKLYKGLYITQHKKSSIDFLRNFGNAQNEIFAEKNRGFQPQDFDNSFYPLLSWSIDIYNGKVLETAGTPSYTLSKIAFDIWLAPNLDAAIDLAFFAIPYQKMPGLETPSDVTTYDRKELLYFNEIDGLSKLQILENYYNALKNPNCGRKVSLFERNWESENYSNDTDEAENGPKDKVNKAYSAIKQFLDLYEVNYQSMDKDKISQLNQARTELIAYLSSENEYAKKITAHWKAKIATKISEIDNRLTTLGTPPTDKSYLTLVADIREAKNYDKYDGDKALEVEEKANTKRIILIGSTGNGKSTLANVLLNKNNNFEEVFKESEGSISETRNIQIEKAEIPFDKDGNEKLELVIIDTVGIGDTKLTTQGVLYKLAEVTSHIGKGLNQIFFVSGGRFTEKEEEAYRLLSSVIFDSKVVNFITIIRTNFPRFKKEEVCQKDREAIQKENKRLSNIVNSSKIIYVDNPPMIGCPEAIEINKKIRADSRQVLLTHLGTCQNVYKPNNLNKLNDRIENYITEEERLKKEIEETQRLMEEQKNLSAQERSQLTEQLTTVREQTRESERRSEQQIRRIIESNKSQINESERQIRNLNQSKEQQIREIKENNERQINELINQLNKNKEVSSALSSFYNLSDVVKTDNFSSKSLENQVKYLKNEFREVVKERDEAEQKLENLERRIKEVLRNNRDLEAKIQQQNEECIIM